MGLGISAYNPYTLLLSLPWPKFFGWSLALYLLLNGFFALVYFALGPRALSDSPAGGWPLLLADFFFSVQTFGTIGFGHVYPATLAANIAVTFEAFVGLMAVALVTGMLFARFSKPTHRLLFSHNAVIAPYQGGRALMFRVMNGRLSEVSDAAVEVVLVMRRLNQPTGSATITVHPREFHALKLERNNVTLFPLGWTVVHPIDDHSPVYGLGPTDFAAREVEILVILRATDEISQQTLQARTSYNAGEIRWGQKFSSMYVRHGSLLAVDARLLHGTEPAELGP